MQIAFFAQNRGNKSLKHNHIWYFQKMNIVGNLSWKPTFKVKLTFFSEFFHQPLQVGKNASK